MGGFGANLLATPNQHGLTAMGCKIFSPLPPPPPAKESGAFRNQRHCSLAALMSHLAAMYRLEGSALMQPDLMLVWPDNNDSLCSIAIPLLHTAWRLT